MSTTSQQLESAKAAFMEGRYRDAEAVLKAMPADDLKVKNNLLAVQFLQGNKDGEDALQELRFDSHRGPNGELILQYEGHETALYNEAVLYARSGLVHEAITLLRRLLEISSSISLPVLVHSLCLFQTLTLTASSLGSHPRGKQEEELIQKHLNENISKMPPELMALITAAFADSSSLHESFKAGTSSADKAVYLNNLGVLALNDGKAHVASLCFTKARLSASSPPSSVLLQQPITYNAGLCALLREDYEEAIRNFLAVQDGMKNSPIYWVRFAEAAVGTALRQQRHNRREDYEKQQSKFSELLQSGKTFHNFELLSLPGAVFFPGPLQEASQPNSASKAIDELTASSIQNALFLLIPPGYTFTTAMEAFPHQQQLLLYAMLYWVALELYRQNYLVASEIGLEILSTHDHPRPLPANLYATLLSYVLEALVHINDPERAMQVLRKTSLSSLISGTSSDRLDGAQRSRVEALFANLALTHILSGSWSQAHSVLDSLLAKIYEAAPKDNSDFLPERDALFAHQLLSIFLVLAQGDAEKATAQLSRIDWSL